MYHMLSEVYLFSADEYIMILSGNIFILYILSILHLWKKKLIMNEAIYMLSSRLISNEINFEMEYQLQKILCY
jgi:hypothetical protein